MSSLALRLRRWGPALAATWLGCLSALSSSPARADDSERRERVLDAVGPPTTPGLSHTDIDVNVEYTVATAKATEVETDTPIETGRAYAYVARWLLDAPLVDRRWFVGISGQVASAAVPSGSDPTTGGNTFVLGNPEVYGRGLWVSESGLAAGGGVSVIVPVPRTYSTLETEVVRVARVVRPIDFSSYTDLTLTARPFFDIRHVTGPVTLQMRQGIDFSILLRDRADNENRYDLAALVSAYVGVRTFDLLTLGLEVQEVYQITADVASATCTAPCDQRRVQVSLSPSMRFHLPPLSPSLSMVFPLSTPLRADVASYIAGRVHLDVFF